MFQLATELIELWERKTTFTINQASLVQLYEQMPRPKYVIAMGACTITGGMFSTDSYSTVQGVDKLIPVDVYLLSWTPKPEAVINALTKLLKKVSWEIVEDRTICQSKKIDVLLPVTNFMFSAVLMPELASKNCSINHHLL
jgi:NADH:ubiquinone oxidoreductase subunit B-like Fe-S oxidoreductase